MLAVMLVIIACVLVLVCAIKLIADMMEMGRINEEKSEYYLPSAVEDLMSRGLCTVSVYSTSGQWYGVTYKEDKPVVVARIQKFKDEGIYPEDLWAK